MVGPPFSHTHCRLFLLLVVDEETPMKMVIVAAFRDDRRREYDSDRLAPVIASGGHLPSFVPASIPNRRSAKSLRNYMYGRSK